MRHDLLILSPNAAGAFDDAPLQRALADGAAASRDALVSLAALPDPAGARLAVLLVWPSPPAGAADADADADADAGAEAAAPGAPASPSDETPRAPRRTAASWAETLEADDRACFEALRGWRNALAQAAAIPPYRVLTNRHLTILSVVRPASLAALAEVDGLGPARLARWGEAILDALSDVEAGRTPAVPSVADADPAEPADSAPLPSLPSGQASTQG